MKKISVEMNLKNLLCINGDNIMKLFIMGVILFGISYMIGELLVACLIIFFIIIILGVKNIVSYIHENKNNGKGV